MYVVEDWISALLPFILGVAVTLAVVPLVYLPYVVSRELEVRQQSHTLKDILLAISRTLAMPVLLAFTLASWAMISHVKLPVVHT